MHDTCDTYSSICMYLHVCVFYLYVSVCICMYMHVCVCMYFFIALGLRAQISARQAPDKALTWRLTRRQKYSKMPLTLSGIEHPPPKPDVTTHTAEIQRLYIHLKNLCIWLILGWYIQYMQIHTIHADTYTYILIHTDTYTYTTV